MNWPSIVLLIMSSMLWLAAFSFITFIVILRISPGVGKMLGFLDSKKMKKIQRRGWWVFIPMGITLAGGVILIVLRISHVFFFTGILLASIPAAGVPGLLLIGEAARSVARAEEG